MKPTPIPFVRIFPAATAASNRQSGMRTVREEKTNKAVRIEHEYELAVRLQVERVEAGEELTGRVHVL